MIIPQKHARFQKRHTSSETGNNLMKCGEQKTLPTITKICYVRNILELEWLVTRPSVD
jgi:hypothetical protein